MSEDLPLPNTFDSGGTETFVISEFRNNVYNEGSTHATPENVNKIKSIKVSVELPFDAGDSASMWIFKSSASGYGLFKFATLNNVSVPGYRRYADFSTGIANLSYNSSERMVISIRPNSTLSGKVKALTVRIEMYQAQAQNEITTFTVDPPNWEPLVPP